MRRVLPLLLSIAWQLRVARAGQAYNGSPLCMPEESYSAAELRVMDDTDGPVAKLGCEQVSRGSS